MRSLKEGEVTVKSISLQRRVSVFQGGAPSQTFMSGAHEKESKIMNSTKIVLDLVQRFKTKSLDTFTQPLTLKGKKRKRERRRLIRDSEVWGKAARMATNEISKATELLEPAEPSKRAAWFSD
jgi:hypothetical protein